MALSADGTTLATGGLDGTIRVWNVALTPADVIARWRVNRVVGVRYSPDGATLAAIGDTGIDLFDDKSGAHKHALDDEVVSATAFSADSRTIAAGTPDGLAIVDLADGTVRRVSIANGVSALAFAGEREVAIVGRDGTARTWNTRTESDRVLGHVESPAALDTFHDWIASGGHDGKVTLWSVAGTSKEWSLGRAVIALRFSPSGSRVAAAGDGDTIRVWDLATGIARDLRGSGEAVFLLAWETDDVLIAAGMAGTRRFDVVGGTSDLVVKPAVDTVWSTALALDPATHTLAVGDSTGILTLRDLRSSEQRTLVGHAGAILGVAFSPHGVGLATIGEDATARIWRDVPHDPAAMNAWLARRVVGSVDATVHVAWPPGIAGVLPP
jgi:WD40 repeat protein